MSNKVYIVISYIWDGEKDLCRIRDVYPSRKRAEKRKRFLERVTLNDKNFPVSFHVIEKTLKGCCFIIY